MVINSTDYFLYLPLMPQVSGGLIEPAHVRISLPRRLRKRRFVLGTVNHVDSRQKVVSWEGPEGTAGQVSYDRLILTAGSVNKLLPIPGIADYAHGFRTIAEAGYLRDHIICPLELASVAADPEERRSRCTFVVVGAGYTGTEVTAQGQLMTTGSPRRCQAWPGSGSGGCCWTPRRIRRPGHLRVRGLRGGARPDPPRPGLRHDRPARPAAGQAGRQERRRYLGKGTAEPYKHADLGFLVDLGGLAGAANPLHIPLSGPTANAITRGYHLSAMSGNRMRVLTDWVLNGLAPPEATSVKVVSAESVPLDVNKPRA